MNQKQSDCFNLTVHPADASAVLCMSGDGFRLRLAAPEISILIKENESWTPYQILFPSGLSPEIQDGETLLGAAQVQTYTWTDANAYRCTYTVTRLKQMAALFLQMTLQNQSGKEIELEGFGLAQAQSAFCGLVPADRWNISSLCGYHFCAGGVCPDLEIGAQAKPEDTPHTFLDSCSLFSANHEKGLLLGAAGPGVSDLEFSVTAAPQAMQTQTAALHITSRMNRVCLNDQATRCSEQLLLCYDTYDRATDRLLRCVAQTHGARTFRGSLAGWCSWYDLGARITPQTLLATLEAYEKEKDRLAPQVIQIDDGYQEGFGRWAYNEKFPDGLREIIDRINRMGCIPGIWMSGLLVDDDNGLIQSHPDWFQRDAAGHVLGSTPVYLRSPEEQAELRAQKKVIRHMMDPSNPDALRWITANIRAKKEEGFRYFKIDFSQLRANAYLYNRSMTRLEAIRSFWRAVRDAVGEDAFLLSCVGSPMRATVGYVDASRVGTDSCAHWGSMGDGCCIEECIQQAIHASPCNQVLFATDPDVCYLHWEGNPQAGENPKPVKELTFEEYRTWYALVGLMGGMTCISDPIQKEPYSELLRRLEVITPPAPIKGRSFLGGTDKWCRQYGLTDLQTLDPFAAVLLWNPEHERARQTFELHPLSALGTPVHIWSFWDKKYLGLVSERFPVELNAHDSVLYRVTAADDTRPVLVGSDLHLSMGAAEIAQTEYGGHRLRIRLTNAGARSGMLVLYSSRALRLAAVSGMTAQLKPLSDGLWQVCVADRSRQVKNELILQD